VWQNECYVFTQSFHFLPGTQTTYITLLF
jgi:hypothetical protein